MDTKVLVEMAELLLRYADRSQPPAPEEEATIGNPPLDLTCGQNGCESTDLDGIGYCINHQPPTYWKFREFSGNDWFGFAGVEDESAKICNVLVDGYEGEMIAESDQVEVHFATVARNDMDTRPDMMSFARGFGKDGTETDDFLLDCDLGYQFADWAVAIMSRKGFGIDDLRDILKMEQVV